MSTVKIEIVDHRGLIPRPVEALLHLACPPSWLVDADATWRPYRLSATLRLVAAGHPAEDWPQHWHWDWSKKQADLQMLAYQCIGIECEGQIQGLAMLDKVGHAARLPPDQGKPLVYIKYIESAPWNVKPLTDSPSFGAVGSRLFETAVRLSKSEGFHGRIGLHSLPQSTGFYTDQCGMTMIGPDPDVGDLPYLELTRERALPFLVGDE